MRQCIKCAYTYLSVTCEHEWVNREHALQDSEYKKKKCYAKRTGKFLYANAERKKFRNMNEGAAVLMLFVAFTFYFLQMILFKLNGESSKKAENEQKHMNDYKETRRRKFKLKPN